MSRFSFLLRIRLARARAREKKLVNRRYWRKRRERDDGGEIERPAANNGVNRNIARMSFPRRCLRTAESPTDPNAPDRGFLSGSCEAAELRASRRESRVTASRRLISRGSKYRGRQRESYRETSTRARREKFNPIDAPHWQEQLNRQGFDYRARRCFSPRERANCYALAAKRFIASKMAGRIVFSSLLFFPCLPLALFLTRR